MDKPRNEMILNCKRILKRKRSSSGRIVRYKARLRISGNQDDADIDHTFAPVVYFTIVRLILSIAAQMGWLIHQIDYDNAFVQGTLNRKVYMHIPTLLDGVEEGKICLLVKSLYGLREAPLICLLYTSPSPRDQRGSRMPSSA